MQILRQLPNPGTSNRVAFMGNTGEGKTILAASLLLSVPNAIVVNTKHDPLFEDIGETISNDERIFRVTKGRFDYRPSDSFLRDMDKRERFFAWAFKAGNRVIYIDELNDICPNAQRYPFMLQKCIKQGRWKNLGIWVTAQEPIRAPSFCFSQAQQRYLFYLGWDSHRKLAEEWFETDIDWSLIPERSHKFLLKTPEGIFGPQPPLAIPEKLLLPA